MLQSRRQLDEPACRGSERWRLSSAAASIHSGQIREISVVSHQDASVHLTARSSFLQIRQPHLGKTQVKLSLAQKPAQIILVGPPIRPWHTALELLSAPPDELHRLRDDPAPCLDLRGQINRFPLLKSHFRRLDTNDLAPANNGRAGASRIQRQPQHHNTQTTQTD
jgi:hypothetical protein